MESRFRIQNPILRWAFIILGAIWIILPFPFDPIPFVDDIVIAELILEQFNIGVFGMLRK
jgi:hypothetical protein